METWKIDRINALARKARIGELSEEEIAERACLRAEYIAAVRRNLRAQLDNIDLVDETGENHRLKPS